MLCMKCGNKIEDDQVFCQHCLEGMEKYPVKPDVHVQLPSRRELEVQKKPSRRRRGQNADELVGILRWKVRRQRILILLLLLALVASAALMFIIVKKTDTPIFENFSLLAKPYL